jgi:hypothetical protein
MSRLARLEQARREQEAIWGGQPLEAVLKPAPVSRFAAVANQKPAPAPATEDVPVRRSPRLERMASPRAMYSPRGSVASPAAPPVAAPKVMHSPVGAAGARRAAEAPQVRRTKAEEEQAALWRHQPLDQVLAGAPAPASAVAAGASGRAPVKYKYADAADRDAISSKYSPVRRKRSASDELTVPADDPWGGMSLHAVMIKAKRSRYLDKPTSATAASAAAAAPAPRGTGSGA